MKPPTPAADSEPCTVAPGVQIDGFTVGELLHEGGMSRIFRCTRPAEPQSGDLVMKVPDLDRPGVAGVITAFETELHVLTREHGRHLPRLHAHGEAVRCPYLVLEYLPGRSLSEALATAPRPVAEIVGLVVPLCQAVHALHRRHIIHLDLKPANVLNRVDGTPVLIDLGIAHHAQLPDLVDGAFSGAVGSAPYIAPEQLAGRRTEPRSDIFALGVILYQLTTGHEPWGALGRLWPTARRWQPPLPPRLYEPAVPPWLQELVLRCLSLDPELRPPTAKQLGYLLLHPAAIQLSARSHDTQPPGLTARVRFALVAARPHRRRDALPAGDRPHRAAHFLVALDPVQPHPALLEEVRLTLRNLARSDRHGFFTLIAVVDETPEEDAAADAGTPPAVRAHAFLRNVVQPLRIGIDRFNFQVLPGKDPAHAVLHYAARHEVDHIVVGTRGHSALRRFLGSVSSRIVAEAPCSVTVVRAPHADGA